MVNFLARATERPAGIVPEDLLRKATREVAAGRMGHALEPGDPRCVAMPELLAARVNGELPGSERLVIEHLADCVTCQASAARLEQAETAFADWPVPQRDARGAWLELAEAEAPVAPRDLQWTPPPRLSSPRLHHPLSPPRRRQPLRPSRLRPPACAPVAVAWWARCGSLPAGVSVPDTVVVTGGAGFIGSHVVDALVGAGMRVIVLDDLSSGDARRVNAEATLETVDITDKRALDGILDRASAKAVYHLAAQASVTASVASPERDCDVNVKGTLNLLEAAARWRAPLVFTSTGGALYGDAAPIPTPESFIPSPLAPYGASKWAAEAYVNTWANSSSLPHAVLRLGNIYGPRQSPHGEAGVVAIFSHALWAGERPRMYGHGKPTRDYVHVADVVEAMLRASGTRGTFNIATGIETSVRQLYSLLADAAGASVEPESLPLREGELERSCIDASHAREVLGWDARIPVAEGLAQSYRELVAGFEAERARQFRVSLRVRPAELD